MNTSERLPGHILELIIAKELGKITKQQENELYEFWEHTPELRQEGDAYAVIIRSSLHMKRIKEIDKDKAWDMISKEVRSDKSYRRSKFGSRWLKYAAILLPLMFVSGYLYHQIKEKQEDIAQYTDIMSTVRESKATLVLSSGETVLLDGSLVGTTIEKEGVVIRRDRKDRISYSAAETASMHRLVVPRGGEYQLVLPDGSIVFVNSDSHIEYPTVFSEDYREVTLVGEAFFMVEHDPERPFVVKSPDLMLKVTGTEFNLYNYPDDIAQATLVKGSVQVSSAACDGIDLLPGQQASISHPNDQMRVKEVDVSLHTSWVEGVFVFKEMTLSDLARRMERWYDVDIVFASSDAENIRFTGAMEKYKTFNDIVWLLEKSANVSFNIKEHTAVIDM